MAASTYYRVLFFHPDDSTDAFLTVWPSGFRFNPNVQSIGIGLSGSLSGMTFTKKIFAPCEINLTLNLYSPTEYKAIINTFNMFSAVKLEHTKDGKNFTTVAQNYIIRRIKPMYTKVGSATCVVLHLTISSPDIILTDKKYCRTYVKEKLGNVLSDAVASASSETGVALTSKQDKMQFLAYKNTSDKPDEFRHPYLVQYNESVYDLVARTANRCGEFLYYENGTLNLGLPFSIETKDNREVIKSTTISAYDALNVNDGFEHGMADSRGRYVYDNKFVCEEKKDQAVASEDSHKMPKYPINNEVAYDEYLGYFEKGKYDSATGEDSVNCDLASDIFSTLLQCTVLYETIVDIAVMVSTRKGANARWAKSSNDKFNNKYFPSNDNPKIHPSDKYGSDQYNGTAKTSLSQFKTNPSSVKTANVNIPNKQMDNTFYDFVFFTEDGVAKSNIELVLSADNIQDIKLGDIISVEEVKDRVYVVTEVTGSEMKASKGTSWCENMTVKAVRIYDNRPLPPPCVPDFIRRGGSQTAYVKDLMDPARAGRVRLQFPWDPASNMSPWARVAMPGANHKGGGEAYFKPSIDDEVLVEYIGGNMERPYVSGFLHNKNGLEYGGRVFTNVISTPGGQTIRQMDRSDGTAIIGSFFPVVGMMRQFIPGMEFEANDNGKKLMGFTEITDTFGMYDIILSSEKRSVTINSPFGKVGINAYTGISIEAPNGDITISGKNVKIEAGNNLVLTSGANIKNASLTNWNSWNMSDVGIRTAQKLVQNEVVAKLIDFKLVRCLIETVIKPVEGTLEIKSNRFLLLEAGDGEAEIPRSAFKKYKTNVSNDMLYILNPWITYCMSVAKAMAKHGLALYNSVVDSKSAYEELINNYHLKLNSKSIIDESKDSAKDYTANYFAGKLNIKIDSGSSGFLNNLICEEIATHATTLSHKANAFYAVDYGALIPVINNEENRIREAITGAIDDIVGNVNFPVFYKREETFAHSVQDVNVNELFRTLAYKVLNVMKNDCQLNVENINGVTDDEWDKLFKGGITVKPPVTKGLMPKVEIGKDINKMFYDTFCKRFKDVGVWDENNSKGSLLLSEKATVTARFNNGVLLEKSNYGDVNDMGGVKSFNYGIKGLFSALRQTEVPIQSGNNDANELQEIQFPWARNVQNENQKENVIKFYDEIENNDNENLFINDDNN